MIIANWADNSNLCTATDWVVYMSLHWFLSALESHDLSQVWLNVFRDQRRQFQRLLFQNEEGAEFGAAGPEIRSVRFDLDHVTPKLKETSVTTCRRPRCSNLSNLGSKHLAWNMKEKCLASKLLVLINFFFKSPKTIPTFK